MFRPAIRRLLPNIPGRHYATGPRPHTAPCSAPRQTEPMAEARRGRRDTAARATARNDPRAHAAMTVVRQLSPNVVEAFAGQARIAADLDGSGCGDLLSSRRP